MQINRRDFMRSLGALGITALFPPQLLAAAAAAGGSHPKRLIMIQLQGGHDGLNSLVPTLRATSGWTIDSRVLQVRPNMAEALFTPAATADPGWVGLPSTDSALNAWSAGTAVGSRGLNLHPAFSAGIKTLTGMAPLGVADDLALIYGIGYPDSSRSHFTGIDNWHAGDPLDMSGGNWLGKLFTQTSNSTWLNANTLHGWTFGSASTDPLRGAPAPITTIVSSDITTFYEQSEALPLIDSATFRHDQVALWQGRSQALAHVTDAHQAVHRAQGVIAPADVVLMKDESQLVAKALFDAAGDIGAQLKEVARAMAGNMPIPVFKIGFGSFDHHASATKPHFTQMEELITGLRALKQELTTSGHWNDVLVCTYSEFGRRVGENGSNGTDHGEASVHLMCGGKVNGGVYFPGQSSGNLSTSLRDAAIEQPWASATAPGAVATNVNFTYTCDMRRMYRTASNWLGLGVSGTYLNGYSAIDGVIAP